MNPNARDTMILCAQNILPHIPHTTAKDKIPEYIIFTFWGAPLRAALVPHAPRRGSGLLRGALRSRAPLRYAPLTPFAPYASLTRWRTLPHRPLHFIRLNFIRSCLTLLP
ncbi:MAG: hypothetical protein RML37_02830 [Chitinophagales bacterium]|nr:hypothetical protein [Chitinophagales bacterium]